MHVPKWLIAAAGLLVVVLVAAIAFLVGRATSRPPAAVLAASPAPQEPPAANAAIPSIPAVPESATPSTATPLSASGQVPPADNSQATAEARARVAAYFKQMDAIQLDGTAGDSQEFANTVVNAAASGDFSGIDDLVRSASEAERRAAALQPPSECAEYHWHAVALLQESRTMIAALREGLKRNDTNALTSVSTTAQSLKSRSDSLAQAEKALRARFGL